MRWKDIIKDHLTFTYKERIGIVTVLIITSAITVLPSFFQNSNNSKQTKIDTTWIDALQKLEKKESNSDSTTAEEIYIEVAGLQYDRSENSNYDSHTGKRLFYFDPNTISKEEWQQLGLRDNTIRIIQNYISKGGKFKAPSDLQRIYGLRKKEFERLAPYINISEEFKKSVDNGFANKKEVEEKKDLRKTSGRVIIDINMADTSDFIALNGIGSKLAVRIINFREKLGGFYSVDQISETFGLPDSTFQKIKPYLTITNQTIKKIHINAADVELLKTHPYIRYNLANTIVAYRSAHGSFSSIEELKKIMIITEEVYQKISPYLTL